ncbi:unnamed protein product [Polarella glacialis]|uniref:Uncharacterized protein n=1 Tax=Polarella glacialis TaxID=89957 RepID=A0A813KYK1_POLGL|nr:unnamed protein product [Polarella glacialis]
MAAQGLDDEAASRWCGWLDGRLEAACVGEWNAEVLDLSSNKLTAAGLGLILWLLLHYHVQCDAVRLSSNLLDDNALWELTRFVIKQREATTALYLSDNQISAYGLFWLLAATANHTLYPLWSSGSFVPLWVELEGNNLPDDALEELFASSRYRVQPIQQAIHKQARWNK